MSKRLTTERILGDFGFKLEWAVEDHFANVVVHKVDNIDADSVPHYEEEEYLSGFVKWDGCTELASHNHWCGPRDYKQHIALLKHVYQRAHELMGREPNEPWETE